MSTFFDSNVLVYAFSTDIRRQTALTAIAGGGIISTAPYGARYRISSGLPLTSPAAPCNATLPRSRT